MSQRESQIGKFPKCPPSHWLCHDNSSSERTNLFIKNRLYAAWPVALIGIKKPTILWNIRSQLYHKVLRAKFMYLIRKYKLVISKHPAICHPADLTGRDDISIWILVAKNWDVIKKSLPFGNIWRLIRMFRRGGVLFLNKLVLKVTCSFPSL